MAFAKIDSSELLNCERRYTFYRCDPVTRTGGGVLIAADNEITFFVSPVVGIGSELVRVCIRLHHKDIVLCACYRPPGHPVSA